MRFLNSVIFLIIALATFVKAQDGLPPERAKMVFRGSNFHSWFEMTLTREDGDKLGGDYFYVKSGRTNPLKVRGTIAADGKFVLREFDRADKQTGEFQGVLSENTEDFGINIRGTWTNPRGKYMQFDADGQIISFTGKRRIETHWIFENNQTKNFNLTAQYPEIIGESAIDFHKINRAFRELTVGTVDKFRKLMFKQTAAQIKNLRSVTNQLTANYNIIYADDDFISLQFDYSESALATEDNLYEEMTVTYDLKDSERLNLRDLFAPGAKYLEEISAFCLKDLQSRPPFNNQKLAEGAWAKGASPIAENYENWNLTRKGLLITFVTEQIAPQPAGFSRVLIPFSELKKIAQPGGAIEKITARESL